MNESQDNRVQDGTGGERFVSSAEIEAQVKHLDCMAGLKTADGGVLSILRVPPFLIIQGLDRQGEENQRLVLGSEQEVAWLIRALKVLHKP